MQDLLSAKIADPDLLAELNELAGELELLYPMRSLRSQYPFRGEEGLDIAEAMRLMDYMQSLDELEHQLERVEYGGDIDEIDPEKLGRLLGEEAKESFEQLRRFLEVLEEAGYIRRKGRGWELTPRAIRKIGEKALAEVYAQIRAERSGQARHARPGPRRRAGRRDEAVRLRRPDAHPPPEDHHELAAAGAVVAAAAPTDGGRLRGLSQRAALADGDGGDGRPLVVDGAARQLPGGEEGGAGARTT